MKILLAVIFFFTCQICFSQIEEEYLYGVGGHEENEKIIRDDSSGVWFIPGSDSTKIVFIAKDYNDYKIYNNKNVLLIEGNLGGRVFVDYFQKQGKWTENYESGSIKSTGNYANNDAVGLWKYYYPNGQLKKTYMISRIHVDSAITYCKNGKYLEFYDDGKYKVKGHYKTTADTSIVISIRPKPNGDFEEIKSKAARSKPSGQWIYYKPDGQIEKIVRY